MSEENGDNNGGQNNGGQNNDGQNNSPSGNGAPVLPTSFKEIPALADFKDVETLGQAYVNLKQYQGSSIRIPTEDAGEETWNEFNEKLTQVNGVMRKPDFSDPEQSQQFYQSIGKPETKDGYAFTPSEELKDFPVDDNRIGMFKEVAHKHNLTKAQFEGIMADIVGSDAQTMAQVQADKEADQGKLRTEWGQAFDQNMTIAVNTAKATGAPEKVIEAMQSGDTGSEFNKWMHSLSTKFNGEGQNLLEKHEQSTHATPEEIQGKIDDIMNNRKHAYWDATHPDHARALKVMIELRQKLAG